MGSISLIEADSLNSCDRPVLPRNNGKRGRLFPLPHFSPPNCGSRAAYFNDAQRQATKDAGKIAGKSPRTYPCPNLSWTDVHQGGLARGTQAENVLPSRSDGGIRLFGQPCLQVPLLVHRGRASFNRSPESLGHL